MGKYTDLVSIVDNLCDEAPVENTRYHTEDKDIPGKENARARGFIHMYLKVKFGLLDFVKREHYLTDGPNDGGIDAYYIDKELRKVYFIQSKFRNNDNNFENKEISYEELLAMDIDQIIKGEKVDSRGNHYNGKILQLQREINEISDLARYEYRVIIIANLREKIQSSLDRLIGRYPVDIYNSEKVYDELVFPIVSGTFYEAKELKITLVVTRESAGSRIQYYPETEYGNCTVNVQFVPTLEIGRILYQYKNSILKYNPRSYLELRSGSINEKISQSIKERTTNEFALFNNGITMLSDDTVYSDRVGKINTAELILTNPQIINGGQTAYTLSRLYDECISSGCFDIFNKKEVLLKVISFNDYEISQSDIHAADKLKLIESISIATNQQSPVMEADRRANDKVQVELQRLIYKEFGLYYERKRGEFSDGINKKYIMRNQIIGREDYLRCCLAISDNPVWARQRSSEIIFAKDEFDNILPNSSNYKKQVFAYMSLLYLDRNKLAPYETKLYARYAIVCVISHLFKSDIPTGEYDSFIETEMNSILQKWTDFENYVREQPENKRYYFKESTDPVSGEKRFDANWQGYYKGRTLTQDLKAFFRF